MRIALSLFLMLAVVACARSMAEIEADAVTFARMMDGHEPRGVTCLDRDTDGDGYVTCTVFRTDRDPYSIQCATRAESKGCKPTVPMVRQ